MKDEKKEIPKKYAYWCPLIRRKREFEVSGYTADCTDKEISEHVPASVSLADHILMRKEIK